MHDLESEYILSRFKEPKLLSDSSDAKIYMVLDTTTNRPYIQKVFPKDTNMDIYRQMQSLVPRNIPKIHHVIEGGTNNYVIEEYISGTRLDELIGNQGKFDATQVVTWILSLCDTLEQLHDASPPIIHRDIKPSNIIITDDGTPKLIDFNISRNYKNDGSTDTKTLGTEYYAAPEQFGFAQTDNRTDIYAIGKLMITLSTGKQQKQEDGLAACGSLKPVIEKCCAIDPTRRYQDMFELRKALAQTRGIRFKQITGVLAVCGVIAVCYFGYQHLGKISHDTPVYDTQEPNMKSDIWSEVTQKEPTPKTATTPAEPKTESTTTPTQETLTTPKSTIAPIADISPEPTLMPLPSESHLPEPITNLKETIDEATNAADVLNKAVPTETINYLLGDRRVYDYFFKWMTEISEYTYSPKSDGYVFHKTDGYCPAFLEINDKGEIYIGLAMGGGSAYYFTNNPDENRAIHTENLFLWFNAQGRSVIFEGMESRVQNYYQDELDGNYICKDSDQELRVIHHKGKKGEIEFVLTVKGKEVHGSAKAGLYGYEPYIEDYGYLYLYFYEEFVFVFDMSEFSLEQANDNIGIYVGQYLKQP